MLLEIVNYPFIHSQLIRRNPNKSKPITLFSSWLNKRVAKSISSNIVGIKIGEFLFPYLGILISSKRVNMSHFNPLVTKIFNTLPSWKNATNSTPGKVVLINT